MLKALLAAVAALIILVGGLFIGADYALEQTTDISLIGMIANVAMLSQPTEKEALLDHPFDKNKDMLDVQQTVNNSVEGMIKYTAQNGYSVEFNNLPDEMKYIISLTDKQVGALAETILEQEAAGQVRVKGEIYMDVELYQIKFESIGEGTTRVNVVFGIDSTSFKELLQVPPELVGILNLIPNEIYVSSTFDVYKGTSAFTYSVEHVGLKVNNLEDKQSADTFAAIDELLGTGTAKELNLQVADAIMGGLVGSEDTRGLAYSLKDIGAKDFNFKMVDTAGGTKLCFVVER